MNPITWPGYDLERDAIDGAEPAKVPVQVAQFNRGRAAVPV